MSLLLGQIAVFLGLLSLFICILSLLVIGIAAPLGLMKIDLTEETEETAVSLVAVLGRASRRLISLITFALLASFRFLVSNLARTVHHVSRSVRKTTKLLITASSWPAKCIYAGAKILLSHRFSDVPKPSPTAHLEHEIKYLRKQAMSGAEAIRKLGEEMHMHIDAAYAAKVETKQAKKAKGRQDALVAHQQKTIKALERIIAGMPQENLQLREKNVALEQEVDLLEEKLGNALEARKRAEERRLETVEEANSRVTKAQDLQHMAEVEKDRAESNSEKAKTNCEDRLKVSASEISNLKNEIAKKSHLDPRIFSQTVEQVHTLHSERDDARDALNSVTTQLEEARAAEATGQSLLQNTRAELQRVETQTGRQLHIARVKLAKSKAEAQREVETARSKSEAYWSKSVADREALTKAQTSLEETERQHRMEIFALRLKHDGNMQTAQSKIDQLEASTKDLQARNDTLDARLVRAQKKAQLPRDPELQNSLTLATAELQRLRKEHATELEGVRMEHKRELQRVHDDHATELQSREREVLRKCEEAYDERLAEWRVGEEKSGQQVDHWRSRAEQAEENVVALNRAAERSAREQGRREQDFAAALRQREDEVVKRCEEAYEARLEEQRATQEQQRGRVEELDSELLRVKEELEDLRASVSQGNQGVVAEDPAASAQIPQTLPVSEGNPVMTDAELAEWIDSLEPVTQDGIIEYFDQQPAANSAVPLQTSPTSPPLEPALELEEPEPDPTPVLDPHLTSISTPAQATIPLATPQHTQAPHGGPIFTPAPPPKGMTPRGPRKAKSKPNHYTQQRREGEAAYDAGLGSKLDFMFFGGPEPSRGPPAPTQSVPLSIPSSSGFGKML